MLKNQYANAIYKDNVCMLRLTLPRQKDGFHGGGGVDISDDEGAVGGVAICPLPASGTGRRVENIRNCDIFIEENNFLIYVDVRLLRFYSIRQFDVKNIKQLQIHFNSKERYFELKLPCLQWQKEEVKPLADNTCLEIINAIKLTEVDPALDKLYALHRITGNCLLQVDDAAPVQFEAHFGFGFASKYKESLVSTLDVQSTVVRIWQPRIRSPLQRSVWREQAEKKDFCSDSYKLNCVELQLPDGHENPMKFPFANLFKNVHLTKDQENLLQHITKEKLTLPHTFSETEIECGLISIVLAICYDVRTTYAEPTCESGWTRSILSGTLCYFEEFTSVRETVHVFLRRSLIYPLYRNFDLGRRCVIDAMRAFRHHEWILQQLLDTHILFETSGENRRFLNRYFIEDYIRYMFFQVTDEQLMVLSKNLKNVAVDLYKKNLRLNLIQHERDMLRELCSNVSLNNHGIANPATSNHVTINALAGHLEDEADEDHAEVDAEEDYGDDEDDSVDDEDEIEVLVDDEGEEEGDEVDDEDEDETDSSSPSETEENSVIEQQLHEMFNDSVD